MQEEVTPIERSFIDKPAQVSLLPWLQEQLQEAPPFFRDTQIDVHLRTYYFYRDNHDVRVIVNYEIPLL